MQYILRLCCTFILFLLDMRRNIRHEAQQASGCKWACVLCISASCWRSGDFHIGCCRAPRAAVALTGR